jgi:DNA ligase-1
MMLQVISLAFKTEVSEVSRLYKSEGDVGNVAEALSKKRNHKKPLSVNQVYDRLLTVAEEGGEGSQDRRITLFANLLLDLDPLSVRYVARIPVGKLRLGFSEKTILEALSWMKTNDKSASKKLESAFQVVPDIGKLAYSVKVRGIKDDLVSPQIGVPVLPMLAQRLVSPTQMIAKMGKVFVEPKYDGLRVVIHFKRHKNKDIIHAFTRNLNNVFDFFPELNKIGDYLRADEVILDSEAVGMDPEMLKIVDFQTTMQRRRKHNIDEKAKAIPLRFQVFDVLYKDGKSTMDIPYYERRNLLNKIIKPNDLLLIDEAIVTEEAKDIVHEFNKHTNAGLEGVMIKKYDTPYIPGRTGWRWVKMKETEGIGKLADTVDAVVMGYTRGKGKRAQFGIGQFLVGVLDHEKFKTITKVGTGLTDELFRELAVRLKELKIDSKPEKYEVHKDLEPDFWVEPSLVVEIAADEITQSPKHTAGLALRFPRLVRLRDDKSPANSTTLSELFKLYRLQKNNASKK